MNCQEAGENLAVALLTRSELDPETADHVASCPICQAEQVWLESVPTLLDSVDPTETVTPAPPELLDRLLVAAARERRDRWRRAVVAIAASVVLVAGFGAWGIADLRSDNQPVPTSAAGPVVINRQATDAATGVSAHVWVRPGAWGSKLVVSISGVEPGTTCTLTVVGVDGHRETAATWKASYYGTASVNGNVSGAPSTLAQLEVADENGKVLVPVPLN